MKFACVHFPFYLRPKSLERARGRRRWGRSWEAGSGRWPTFCWDVRHRFEHKLDLQMFFFAQLAGTKLFCPAAGFLFFACFLIQLSQLSQAFWSFPLIHWQQNHKLGMFLNLWDCHGSNILNCHHFHFLLHPLFIKFASDFLLESILFQWDRHWLHLSTSADKQIMKHYQFCNIKVWTDYVAPISVETTKRCCMMDRVQNLDFTFLRLSQDYEKVQIWNSVLGTCWRWPPSSGTGSLAAVCNRGPRAFSAAALKNADMCLTHLKRTNILASEVNTATCDTLL